MERFQRATVAEAQQIMASTGVRFPAGLRPHMLRRRVDPHRVRSYADLYDWLGPGQLPAEPPPDWAQDWAAADPGRFTV
ncbi:hypothetical protein MUY14_16955 [Amycolatopsis sp. FBCC-B4732]|uniref:hypothetical protein n=1 Tax=Amycolatopsis sp. FBCC-B4732 TaxID=3079339 RepID=UPI001FF51363|nr:hypothetical protein [Amycolatopsis sp. FBCC-B4732]UOX93580.1 hypothetical protein MUY14_16955 [Amycolatopsis sp. FBCC-B4732]